MSHRRVKHRGTAVGQDRCELALRLHRRECICHLRIGIELQVKGEKLVAQARLVHVELLERIVQRIARHVPEIGVHTHQAAEPAIFELLLPPQPGNVIGMGADLAGEPGDGARHVEQRAIGVEHAGPDALKLLHAASSSPILPL